MNDIYILNIETSTKACSVSINCNGILINCKEIVSSGFSHSEKLLPFPLLSFPEEDVSSNFK